MSQSPITNIVSVGFPNLFSKFLIILFSLFCLFVKEFYDKVKKYKLEDIICVDVTSISSLLKRNHYYSELEKRCIIKTQSQEVFKKYIGIFAISTGVLGWELYDKGGINIDKLLTFLVKHITSKYNKKLIILDNKSSHWNERIKNLINTNNKILYFVSYQHYTNAIENFFSMMKLQKLTGLTYINLKTNIQNVINKIPK